MARYLKSVTEDIRSVLLLSDVVKEDVRLVKKGMNWSGLCPFHFEKTPSFSLNDQKGFFYCFGCMEKGDVITYVMKKRGILFKEALEELAQKADIDLSTYDQHSANKIIESRSLAKEKLLLDRLCSIYENLLHKNLEKSHALAYCFKRGLTLKTICDFGLGLSPPFERAFDFIKMLSNEGFSDLTFLNSGLFRNLEENIQENTRENTREKTTLKESNKGLIKILPLFRNRLMFPIRDSSGDVVGFGARLIEDSNLDKQLEVKHEAFSKETEPKYLNSKETTLFQKGHLLYGYHLARKNITKESGFILVEGYMDVIRLHQEGFSTAVAPLGTAVTEHQLRLLWKSQKSPIICLDADQAGINATMKVLERALPYINSNQTLFFCLLHEAKDPDSFISFFGKNRFQDKLSQARSFVDMFWKFCLKKANLETNLISDFCLTLENFEKSPSPERRAFLSDTVKNYVHQIKDQTLQVFYLKEFQKRENELWDAVDFKFSLKNKSNQRERRIIKTNCLQETSKENIKIQPISFSPEYQKINVNINCQINLESIIDQDWQSKILLAIVLLNPILIEYTQEEVSLLKFFDMSWKQAKDVVLAVSSNFDAMESNLLLRNIITQIENADCLMQEACDLVDLHIPFLRKKRDSNTRDDFKKDCSEVDFRNEKDLLAIWKKMFETFVVRSSLKREIEDLSCVVKKTQDAQSWKRLCLLKKAALQRISQADVV